MALPALQLERSTRMLGPLSATVLRYRPRARLARHHHARASLSLMLEGCQRETVGQREYECTRLSAVLKGSGIEHSNQVGPGAACGLFVEMPPETEAALCDTAGAPLGTRHFSDRVTRQLVQRIAVELRLRQPGSALLVEGLLFELLGTLLRTRSVRHEHRTSGRLARALDYLEAHIRQHLTIAEVAAQAGIHPSYLAELFRQRFGMSVGEWVRIRRLELAREALKNRILAISAIAAQSGFADQSHLTRHFRARFGVTPAEYRRALP